MLSIIGLGPPEAEIGTDILVDDGSGRLERFINTGRCSCQVQETSGVLVIEHLFDPAGQLGRFQSGKLF